FAQVDGLDAIDDKIADKALNALDVDKNGLDEMDVRILKAIIENYSGGPVGLGTLGVAVGEDKGTIEEVYEPFLIQEGFMQRTPKGRVAAARAYQYLGVKQSGEKGKEGDLFSGESG
ncbi:MAG: Holliday junction DNA helicase RuvB C-terminal domain-containing protein, partial [Balneolaceae bacterium]|nr:Holliday junction DNA helicase RuvB C-terminal domain-containing protein [Balneolaceae bacterium]